MIETKSPPEVERQFEWLTSAVRRVGNEAQMRVANHLRAVTNGRHFLLPNYHTDPLISDADKSALYKRVFNALCALNGKPDWSLLQGQPGNGHPRVDPIDAQMIPPLREQPEPSAEEDSKPEPVNGGLRRQIIPGDIPKPTPPPAPVPAPQQSPRSTDLASVLADAIKDHLKLTPPPATLDDGKVREIVEEQLAKLDIGEQVKRANMNGAFPTDRVQKLITDAMSGAVRRIELVTPTGEIKPIKGLVHKQFEIILKMTRCRTANGHPVPLWLDGPPGGGKSHLMEQVAEALGLDPYILAIGPSDTKSIISGSVATGEFKPGIAYLPYKNGGLLGIDEIAAGDPGVLVSINSLVANGSYRFPNGELVKKHKDFHVIVADNTRGHGNAKGMIRNRLDAATLDRFAFLKVDYDDKLESSLCGNANWAAYVKKIRDYIASNSSESVYITPRASINGAALLAGGVDVETVLNSTVFKFTSADLKSTIISNIGTYKP